MCYNTNNGKGGLLFAATQITRYKGWRFMSEEAKVSKAQQRAVHKYVKANYDRLDVTIPKGQKEVIKAHADGQGESVNGFINRAIAETMERDNTTTG